MLRYALVFPRHNGLDVEQVKRYLPSNYQVIWTGEEGAVIAGRDDHGWTLDGYVIPRLGSGLIRADEIDLSHPVMMKIPATNDGTLTADADDVWNDLYR